jgi:hypothetical protein
MDRRRFLLPSLAGAVAAPLAAEAQETGKVYRLGYVAPAAGRDVRLFLALGITALHSSARPSADCRRAPEGAFYLNRTLFRAEPIALTTCSERRSAWFDPATS